MAALACGGATTTDGGDAGTDSGGGDDAAAVTCNGQTCPSGEKCVITTSSGGACELPDDAGVCPNGTHTTGCCDNTTVGYACQPLPSACGGKLSCPCAETLCQCGGCNIDNAGDLTCACEYP